MPRKAITSPPPKQPGYLRALLDPLGTMALWTSQEAAATELTMLAQNAIGMRNHSLWWNYIYLHERYVTMFVPSITDRLPGFPDMDTAVKVGAPSVYNWYYAHKELPMVPWSDSALVDLCLCRHAGFLTDKEVQVPLQDAVSHLDTYFNFDARNQTAPPLWLLASACSRTSEWGALMNACHNSVSNGQPTGISALDRLVVQPAVLWQWQCLQQKDISFLPQDLASQALDTLRMETLNETLRTQCEKHFLSYFPQCKPEADIAFELGGPLWIAPVDKLDGPLTAGMFDSSHEILHLA